MDRDNPDPASVEEAAAIIVQGGLVAFPTETVYGLGADATCGPAVARIFRAKRRPMDNPIIVHVSCPDEVLPLVQKVDQTAEALMSRFWPGPLSILFRRSRRIPPEVTGGLDTVAIRCPDHPVALALIRAAGVPIGAPSANMSGRPSPTTAEHVLEDMEGRIEGLLDAGPTGVGLESTVVDLSCRPPVILRPGAISPEDLAPYLGEVRVADRSAGPPRSPGTKYVHYSPRARVVLVDGRPELLPPRVAELARHYSERGERVAVLCRSENVDCYQGALTLVLGPGNRPDLVARQLFARLREADLRGVTVVVAEGGFPRRGLGLAIMNRLEKASDEKITVSGGDGHGWG